MESKKDLAYDDPSKTFVGVSFVLLGFNSCEKDKTRAKLLEGGGFDAGEYGPDCTHVIVNNLIYDDPICITARRDGKTLVTAQWVEHSFDVGMLVDPTSVMYRPLRDLNGIPGAKSLLVCLTGYQRHDRDDIMTMVGLMGAKFSKPLVANKVTHLICYKFEGDKYELAKKMKTIKLVNHQWLKDCLKAWEILPEADYDKSGFELEMMEAEAKDSEEETDDVAAKNDVERKSANDPQYTQVKLKTDNQSLVKQDVSKGNLHSFESKSLTNVANTNEGPSNVGKEKETKFDNIVCAGKSIPQITSLHPEKLGSCNIERPGKTPSSPQSNTFDANMSFEEADNVIALMSESAKLSPHSSMSNPSCKTYSRKSTVKSSLLLSPERTDSDAGNPSTSKNLTHEFHISALEKERVEDGVDRMETPPNGTILHLDNGGKSKMSISNDNHDSPENTTAYTGERTAMKYTDNVAEVLASAAVQELSDLAPQSSPRELEYRSLSSVSAAKVVSLSKTEHPIPPVVHQSDVQNIDAPSPGNKNKEVKSSNNQAQSKTLGREKVVKKTLGSRTRLSKGNARKPKNHETLLLSDSGICSTGEIGMRTDGKFGSSGNDGKFGSSKKLKRLAPTSSGPMDRNAEMKNLGVSENETIDKDGPIGDETESPKDKEETETDVAVDQEKSAQTESHLEDMCTDRRGDANHSAERTDESIIGADAQEEESGNKRKGVEAETAVCSKKNEVSESTPVEHVNEKIITKRKRGPLKKTKSKKQAVTDVGNPNEVGQKDGLKDKPIKEKAKTQNEETSSSVDKTKACKSEESKNIKEAEKENSPFVMRSKLPSHDDNSMKPLKESKAANTKLDSPKVNEILKVKTEPVWFILSGHKLQRKEFQQVIKRLKGRVCRDSHKWSYQATHFIVPDPVKRTEKFFAAAASGSWILKTDYLAASNEAGRFLDEEPHEWHKKCLTEDGAINLEAPRKWRLIRERTGHGAFCGMRVIIYGECIAPPLETLKRVIKAGDGTILATSPPYTRFLQSSVDFAIVSPSMPRVDMWVQEFLRQEIPCVLADYLVEYVCKPGYSLERHVLYNTQVWAEKSLNNLRSRMEEVVEDTRRSYN